MRAHLARRRASGIGLGSGHGRRLGAEHGQRKTPGLPGASGLCRRIHLRGGKRACRLRTQPPPGTALQRRTIPWLGQRASHPIAKAMTGMAATSSAPAPGMTWPLPGAIGTTASKPGVSTCPPTRGAAMSRRGRYTPFSTEPCCAWGYFLWLVHPRIYIAPAWC